MKNKVISLQFVVMHRLSFKLSVLSSLKNQIENRTEYCKKK